MMTGPFPDRALTSAEFIVAEINTGALAALSPADRLDMVRASINTFVRNEQNDTAKDELWAMWSALTPDEQRAIRVARIFERLLEQIAYIKDPDLIHAIALAMKYSASDLVAT